MQALKGILSLQEAMQVRTVPSLNPALLQLGALIKLDKSNVDGSARYQQPLLYGGSTLTLQTPAILLPKLIYQRKYQSYEAVLIPLTSWLNQQLRLIDDFARTRVTLPPEYQQPNQPSEALYKPIYAGSNMFMMVGSGCQSTAMIDGIYHQSETQTHPQYGYGRYTFTIQIPWVYIGRHRMGEAYSVTLRVTHIHCESMPRGTGPLYGPPRPIHVSQPPVPIGYDIPPPTSKSMAGILPTTRPSPPPPPPTRIMGYGASMPIVIPKGGKRRLRRTGKRTSL